MVHENYPENFEQFIAKFTTEQNCYDYIMNLRWPQGFVCPRCHK